MPDYRETENLEEQLRRDRKLAAARRLRRRLPWAIPLALIVLAVCILLFFLIRHLVLKKQEKNRNSQAVASFISLRGRRRRYSTGICALLSVTGRV